MIFSVFKNVTRWLGLASTLFSSMPLYAADTPVSAFWVEAAVTAIIAPLDELSAERPYYEPGKGLTLPGTPCGTKAITESCDKNLSAVKTKTFPNCMLSPGHVRMDGRIELRITASHGAYCPNLSEMRSVTRLPTYSLQISEHDRVEIQNRGGQKVTFLSREKLTLQILGVRRNYFSNSIEKSSFTIENKEPIQVEHAANQPWTRKNRKIISGTLSLTIQDGVNEKKYTVEIKNTLFELENCCHPTQGQWTLKSQEHSQEVQWTKACGVYKSGKSLGVVTSCSG